MACKSSSEGTFWTKQLSVTIVACGVLRVKVKWTYLEWNLKAILDFLLLKFAFSWIFEILISITHNLIPCKCIAFSLNDTLYLSFHRFPFILWVSFHFFSQVKLVYTCLKHIYIHLYRYTLFNNICCLFFINASTLTCLYIQAVISMPFSLNGLAHLI